jgi:hypothetical protein
VGPRLFAKQQGDSTDIIAQLESAGNKLGPHYPHICLGETHRAGKLKPQRGVLAK